MGSVKVDFEKFDGKGSFTLWKVRVEDLLVQLGLEAALEDRPEEMTDKKWMSLERRACATVRACLADEVLYGVLEEKTPKGLWSRLHVLYMGKNMCNKLMLKKQLYSLRMQEGEDVAGHIQRFDRMSMDLLNIGVELQEEDKSLLLLCSLPGSFDPLVTTLLYGKETLVYEEIVSVLRSNEQRERMTKGEVLQEGLSVSERSRKGKTKGEQGKWRLQKGSREGRKCFFCGEAGHFKRECPLWKKCKGKEREEESLGTVSEGEESDELLVVSEEPAGCGWSETASERSADCSGSEGAETGDEVQRQAQQGSVEWLNSGLSSAASIGLQIEVEHRGEVGSPERRRMPRVQSGEVQGEDRYPSTSAKAAQSQVERRVQIQGRCSEETVSGGASNAASAGKGTLRFGSLRFLRGSPGREMQLLSGREPTEIKRVPREQGSSAGEAVIPKASKDAQTLKMASGGKHVRTKGCLGSQRQQDDARGHCRICQVCQGLVAPRWRL